MITPTQTETASQNEVSFTKDNESTATITAPLPNFDGISNTFGLNDNLTVEVAPGADTADRSNMTQPTESNPQLIDLKTFTTLWATAWDGASVITSYKSIAYDETKMYERKMAETTYNRIKATPALWWILDPKAQWIMDIVVIGTFVKAKITAVKKEAEEKAKDKKAATDTTVDPNSQEPTKTEVRTDKADGPANDIDDNINLISAPLPADKE